MSDWPGRGSGMGLEVRMVGVRRAVLREDDGMLKQNLVWVVPPRAAWPTHVRRGWAVDLRTSNLSF
eukprot:1533506-Pyramimonas_sp.AAC.1